MGATHNGGTPFSEHHILMDHLSNQKKRVETTLTNDCYSNEILEAKTAQICTVSFPQKRSKGQALVSMQVKHNRESAS